jgi:hypothetical protein
MDNIRETSGTSSKLREDISRMNQEIEFLKQQRDTKNKGQEFKYPWKWKWKMNQSVGKQGQDKILVFYLNIKGEIEPPKILPLYSGNIIIYKNKAYEFDPRATWLVKGLKKQVKAVIIREIDRRPVSNLDWDEIKARGDATDSDEILVKMVTKAVIEKQKVAVGKGAIVLVVLAIIGLVVFFLLK